MSVNLECLASPNNFMLHLKLLICASINNIMKQKSLRLHVSVRACYAVCMLCCFRQRQYVVMATRDYDVWVLRHFYMGMGMAFCLIL